MCMLFETPSAARGAQAKREVPGLALLPLRQAQGRSRSLGMTQARVGILARLKPRPFKTTAEESFSAACEAAPFQTSAPLQTCRARPHTVAPLQTKSLVALHCRLRLRSALDVVALQLAVERRAADAQ